MKELVYHRYLLPTVARLSDKAAVLDGDFTATYANRNASTGDFEAIVNKHMKPQMDLGGDKKINWFFSQFVYGSEVGSYHLNYKITDEPVIQLIGEQLFSLVDDAGRRKITVTGLGDLRVGPGERADDSRQLLPDVATGKVRPHVGQSFPLVEAARAHALIEAREAIAKTLLISD